MPTVTNPNHNADNAQQNAARRSRRRFGIYVCTWWCPRTKHTFCVDGTAAAADVACFYSSCRSCICVARRGVQSSGRRFCGKTFPLMHNTIESRRSLPNRSNHTTHQPQLRLLICTMYFCLTFKSFDWKTSHKCSTL